VPSARHLAPTLPLLALLALLQAGCGGKIATPSVDATPVARAQLALGDGFGCAVRQGEVWCWGGNNDVLLGDCYRGSPCAVPWKRPTRIPGVKDVVGIAAHDDQVCATTAGGAIVCWGGGLDGMTDCLAIGGSCGAPPTPIGAGDAVQVAPGGQPSCAVRRDGTVACWGELDTLGREPTSADALYTMTPQPLPLGLPALQVSAWRGGACVLTVDRAIACWGMNESPTRVDGFDDVVEIAPGGGALCARRGDGTVWCQATGASFPSPEGSWDAGYSPVPAPIPGLDDAVAVRAEASFGSFFAIRRDGRVVHWGACLSGSCADGQGVDSVDHAPREIPALAGTVEIATNGYATCVRTVDDRVRCAGANAVAAGVAGLVDVTFE
jgi:alpha-tubulin suppressor-like RCC1 family protein